MVLLYVRKPGKLPKNLLRGAPLGRAPFAQASNFQPDDLNFKLVLRFNFGFQPIEGPRSKFLDCTTSEASQMKMIFLSFRFKIVLFALNVHEVELIDDPHPFQQVNRPVNCRPIDSRVAFSRQPEQAGRIQVRSRILNRLDHSPPLRRHTDLLAFQSTQQVKSFECLGSGGLLPPCELVAI